MKENVIERIYELRRKFIILGLTGRTGSGCTTVADLLTKDFKELNAPIPSTKQLGTDNDERKYSILYKSLEQQSEHYQGFKSIKASDIILYFALLSSFKDFNRSFGDEKANQAESQNKEQKILEDLSTDFSVLQKKIKDADTFIEQRKSAPLKFDTSDKKHKELLETAKKHVDVIFQDLPQFKEKICSKLKDISHKPLFDVYQRWGNDIRRYGKISPSTTEETNSLAPANLAHKINMIIKLLRDINEVENKPTFITIDALRNPYEALYFRERYSAFYLMAVHTSEEIRQKSLYEQGYREQEVRTLDKKESDRKSIKESYYDQDLNSCLELADIHLTRDDTPVERNFKLKTQIVRFVSLILHPGLVPPSKEERLMQIAFTAKLNSGCISRQVGAAVTDENFSLKSIGWNTVPQGQTPCSLRNLDDLHKHTDISAYSSYEQKDPLFRDYVNKLFDQYSKAIAHSKIGRQGIQLCYCFKDLQTGKTGEKNQVHTRSLHAEENAFLQLAKYGNTGIEGGRLFTTASPCVLCAKKAYQLGIKDIYYIDAYPDITNEHILNCGNNTPNIHLFNGAIGRAYTQLYNPFIPLKDEIEYLTGVQTTKINKSGNEQKDYANNTNNNPTYNGNIH